MFNKLAQENSEHCVPPFNMRPHILYNSQAETKFFFLLVENFEWNSVYPSTQ